jgi:hypothetical protein
MVAACQGRGTDPHRERYLERERSASQLEREEAPPREPGWGQRLKLKKTKSDRDSCAIALFEVGHIVHVLQLAWHLERSVDKPPELVEHVTVEIAQVEALDLLREVHVVPSQSDEP